MPLRRISPCHQTQGAKNCGFDTLLPADLDVFVLFSSEGGVTSNRVHANYCIGNKYKDTLSQYCVSKGLKATALNLVVILSVGDAAKYGDVLGNLRAVGFSAIR